jgi:hypothetical protein
MFVNSLPFFVPKSRDLNMISIEFLPSRTAEQLCSSIRKIMYVYHSGGFMVSTCLMDMVFEPLVDTMEDVVVNTTAAREHVGDIEWGI